MDIQITDQDTETLDAEIEEMMGDISIQHDFSHYNEEDIEALVGKAMKLGEMYEKKRQQDGFVLVPKLSANYLYSKVPELGFAHQDEKDTVLYHLNYLADMETK